MFNTVCPIWHTPANHPNLRDMDAVYYDSSRAGGLYGINDRAAALLGKRNSPPSQRACLTTWLFSQRKSGVRVPLITYDIIRDLALLRPLSTTERIERALLYFNERTRIGEKITITPPPFSPNQLDDAKLMVVSECATSEEFVALLKMIGEMGWLAERDSTMTSLNFTLTAAGWLKVEELAARPSNTSQAFVAMWFNPQTDALYNDGIDPAIRDLGYRAVRIDQKEHINKIDDEIISEIRRSKFLVADFTCEREKVRGGVYFEAGFAMALPIPVIWTCSKQSLNDVHFDTRQYNHIVWETPADLRKALAARIGAVIGDGPLKSVVG